MEILFSIVTLVGVGFAATVGVKWMLRSGQIARKQEQPLSPTDLKVLEESAERLMTDLRAAADECVTRVELALAQAESRIRHIEQVVLGASQREHVGPTTPIDVPAPPVYQASTYETPESTQPAACVARQSGMTTGEVELLRGLRGISSK